MRQSNSKKKPTLASNFKNETVISFLQALKIGKPGQVPLTVSNYMFNVPGDGKVELVSME